MKMKIKAFYFFIIFFVALSAFAEVAPVQTTFPQTIKLGDKTWTLKINKETDAYQTGLYVPIDTKTEFETKQFIFQKLKQPINKTITPLIAVKGQMVGVEKLGEKVTYNILESNSTEAIVDVRSQLKKVEDIERIIITPNHNLIILHFGIISTEMGEAERKKWIDIIKNVDIHLFTKE